MFFDSPIESLPATSPITIRRFKSVAINTYWDLLNYFPTRYENYSLVSSIARMQPGELVTVKGRIVEMKQVYTRRGLTIQKAKLQDKTGTVELQWFNQPYLVRLLKEQIVSIAGEVSIFKTGIRLEPKEYEMIHSLNDTTLHTGRIVPIYPEKRGLSSHLIREKVFRSVYANLETHQKLLSDMLPSDIVSTYGLVSLLDSYRNIHFPDSLEKAKSARRRFAFEELFLLQLFVSIVRKEWHKEKVGNLLISNRETEEKQKQFIRSLPFALTDAQSKAIEEMISDMKKPTPMNRFLQGDVGSGKTVVAAIGCYFAYLNGYASLFMAPTEILAQQHFQTLRKLFSTPGVEVGLVTGNSMSSRHESMNADIVVGTHALLNRGFDTKKVGFVVIDEQHRFGVQQRALLKEKGINPHLLTMTATPIPRTVMLTLYGELDLSVIDEMPKGRLPVKTYNVPHEKRQSGYEWVRREIKEKGVQAFVICPLIEESEKESMKTVKAATKEFERLKQDVFPDLKVALIHGRLKSDQKNEIMSHFKDGAYDILVATSLVEVGIDIPNATIMIIEAAERFGLAQLHQLRGRVGRSSKQSYCLLYTDQDIDSTVRRLNFFAKTQSGMELAEYDLKLRGPGQLFGTKQHGYQELKIASLSDLNLIEETKKAVDYFESHSSVADYPELSKRLQEINFRQISRD